MTREYSTIFLPTRPQPDTIVGIFLLSTFGREQYPGIENAEVKVLTTMPEGETASSLEEQASLIIFYFFLEDHNLSKKNINNFYCLLHDI